MKKSALILSILLITPMASLAYVDSQYMSSEQFLVNIGYSKEMKKVLGINTEDPYRENYVEKNTLSRVLKRTAWYLSPDSFNDYSFYNHSPHFDGRNWKDL